MERRILLKFEALEKRTLYKKPIWNILRFRYSGFFYFWENICSRNIL